VPGPAGDLGRGHPGVQSQQHRRVPQVIRAAERWPALRFGEGLLAASAVLAEYQAHYNTARPHQGVPDAEHQPPRITAGDFHARRIRRKLVLSGLINEYVRAA
jgi:hypothetical protein